MRESRIIGAGVVGLGVGEQHARAFALHDACRLRAVCDADLMRAERIAAIFPGASAESTFEALLTRQDIDVISIASYDDAHFEHVRQALRAGRHVFVEKPICRSAREVAELKQLWLSAGGRLKLRSNLVLRAAPLYRWLREEVARGAFGSVYAFDGDYLYGRLHKITEGWRGRVDDYSVMEGGGIHLVDLMMWITGQRPARVSASGNRMCTKGTEFRFNDFSAATFEFESGLVARITANFGCVHRHQHVVRLFGTTATFLYDDVGARLHRTRDPESPPEVLREAALPSSKGALIPDFVQAVLTDADDSSETQGFFDGICICVAADKAAASGKKEAIEYV